MRQAPAGQPSQPRVATAPSLPMRWKPLARALPLAVALAAPVFPLGNLSAGAATLYGVLAATVLLLCARDRRSALLFVSGPLLGPPGVLGLVPPAVQPARG